MDDKTLTRLGLVLIVLGVAGCLLFVGSMMVSEDDEDDGSDLKYTLYMGLDMFPLWRPAPLRRRSSTN